MSTKHLGWAIEFKSACSNYWYTYRTNAKRKVLQEEIDNMVKVERKVPYGLYTEYRIVEVLKDDN